MKRMSFLMLSIAVVIMAATGVIAQRRGRGAVAGASDPGLKHEVKDAKKRGAVCNDGSPAIFYLQPGKYPDRRKCIVFM